MSQSYNAKFVITNYLVMISLLIVGCGSKNIDISSQSLTQQQVKLEKTWTITIMPFEIVGKSKLSGEEIMNLLNTRLIGLEGFKLVEREAFRSIMSQLGFNISDLASEANRTKIGRMLGTQLICLGSFNNSANLITARMVFTETGNILLSANDSNKNELKRIDQLAQNISAKLESPKIVNFLNEQDIKPKEKVDSSVAVRVKGYGIIIDNDMVSAREFALKDAYAKAISQVCGVKLARETQIENLQLVRDKILTESIGYIANYQIIEENPKSQLGYEVTVNADVSQNPPSDLEKLRLMVKYLFAEPRIAIIIDGETKKEIMTKAQIATIEGQFATYLGKVGFLLVDTATIEDKERKYANSLSDKDAARLGAMLNANITIRGSLFVEIIGRLEVVNGQKLELPVITAQTSGTIRVIQNDTAEILYSFSHDDLKDNPKLSLGVGDTEEYAIRESVNNFIKSSADNLIKGLISKLGEPIKLRLELHNTDLAQAEQFERQIQNIPNQIMLGVKLTQYADGIADYEIKTSIRSQELQRKLLRLIDPNKIGVKELISDRIEPGIINISLKI